MPTYLVHGFRWPRPLIRIHIILQNLDDAAAEWLMAPATTRTLHANLTRLHPECMTHLPQLRFIEQYDPADESTRSQPYAYVCDVVHEVKLGVEVEALRGHGVSNDAWGAMVDLRDGLAPGEKVAWWVVVCGDPERVVSPTVQMLGGQGEGVGGWSSGSTEVVQEGMGDTSPGADEDGERKKSAFSKLFGSGRKTDKTLRRSSSSRNLSAKSSVPGSPESPPPPLPQTTILPNREKPSHRRMSSRGSVKNANVRK